MRFSVRRSSSNYDHEASGSPPPVTPVKPWAQRAARGALWGAVALGAVGGVLGMVRPAPVAPTLDTAAQPASVPASVAGFAELTVRTWLSADDSSEATVGGLFAVDPQRPAGTAGRRSVTSASAVAARLVTEGYWAVTVAVELSEVSNDNHVQSVGLRFFEVGIVEDDAGGLVAVSEPAMVAAPHSNGRLPRPAGPALASPDATDPLTPTVQGFLQALLAGGGDASRYLAPNVVITAVEPPPFTEVTVARQSVVMVSDTRARVRVGVRGVSALGVTWTLGYELELTARDERWEVQSLSGAPTLSTSAPRSEEPQPAPPPPMTEPSQPNASEPGA